MQHIDTTTALGAANIGIRKGCIIIDNTDAVQLVCTAFTVPAFDVNTNSLLIAHNLQRLVTAPLQPLASPRPLSCDRLLPFSVVPRTRPLRVAW